MIQDRDIKYVGREFTDFRAQLIEYAKNYFPDSYNDFSPTSPGMMFIEMAAYVGDVLAFYQDTQLQETYLQYAKNPSNLYNLAYMMGYSPKVIAASQVEIQVTQLVDATGANYDPDWSQALKIGPNTRLKSSTGGSVNFIIDSPIDFYFSSSYDPTIVRINSLIGFTPNKYELSKTVKAFSGEVRTVEQTIGSVEKFKTITIADRNIQGVLSITDSNGGTWTEVPFLGQETVFVDTPNTFSDTGLVPNLLSLQKVPRRFVTRFTSAGELQIQFGSGVLNQDDSIITPNPTNVGLGLSTVPSRLKYAYDPSNFLYTQTYGLAPQNTVLTITYLVGGGAQANVPSNTITEILSTGTISGINTVQQNTLRFNNPRAATGGRDGDSIDELRQNTLRAFNEQNRAVTLQDYAVRALSMPTKYGSIAKIYTAQDQLSNPNMQGGSMVDNNPLALSIYTLAFNSDNKLVRLSSSLKNNLKQYLAGYMILTDAINIKDAFIVNIELNFDVIVRNNYQGRDVLLRCTNLLKEYFDINKWNINQPINLSSIYTLLDQEKGVQTVQKVEIYNKVGGQYSQYAYDIYGATRNNIIYPSYDPMIFEIKYPDIDINGRITTL